MTYRDPGDQNVDKRVEDSTDPDQMGLFGGVAISRHDAPSYGDTRIVVNPKPDTQCGKVLAYMREHGSISDLQAFTELRIRRLAARIYDLRQLGWQIESEEEAHEGGTHARYTLAEDTHGG